MQLDIFEHSRDVILRNDVVNALQRREAPAARSAWQALSAEFPLDASVAPLDSLIGALEQAACAPLPDHDAVRDARRALDDDLALAARRILGETGSVSWLAPLWRALAQRAASLPYRAARSDDHAAPLWLRAGDTAAAAEVVAGIESWRRIPAPLGWMIEARHRTDGLEAIWALLAELAWLSPVRFDDVSRRLGDPSLDKLRKQFDASFEGEGGTGDLAWLPAWLLVEKSALAPLLRQAQPTRHGAPEQTMRLLLELLGLERQGRHRELVERRRVLRELHPFLYGAYMKTR